MVYDANVEQVDQVARADRLRVYHFGKAPLVLPNAWDVASARAVVDEGFKAVATTSAGVAEALGWADEEKTPYEEMLKVVARIAQNVEVPVSADIESGYGLSPGELAEHLIATGAAGCNLEDTDHTQGSQLTAAGTQAKRLAAFKDAVRSLGVDIVLNARIDVFLRQVGDPQQRVDFALERAHLYAKAGADCVYPIGATEEELARFVSGFSGPVNGLARPSQPRLSKLLELRLARISFGPALERLGIADLRHRLAAIATSDDRWGG